ncbi:C40 family peptidase [Nocardia colli]|uniref:C40 family peptidase n=1 Tax=Nocardia colli TaxID=2545717 RepID=UPI0035D66A3A
MEQDIRIGGLSAKVTIDGNGLRAELAVPPPPAVECPPPLPDPKDPPSAAPERPAPAPGTLSPAPPLDPSLLSTGLLAGLTAMSALPMIVLALRGLSDAGAASGSTPGGVALDGTGAGTPAEQARALGVLRSLADVYGDQPTTDPGIAALRDQSGSAGGSGSTAAAIKAKRLYQRTRAAAFKNVDIALLYYIQQVAQNNAVDRQAIRTLLTEVNAALAKLGPDAYTARGRQRVHDVLTAALNRAQRIVAASNVSAEETAAAINQLTAQYLHNITGRNFATNLGGSSTATAAVQTAIATLYSEIGKPYIWGAQGPDSFDCSGLTSYSAKSAGVDIPRTAAEQYNNLPKVLPPDPLRPGDLVFPESRFVDGQAKHVMMYVGNGKCVESPQPGGYVQEVNLPANFRAARWSS